MDHPRVLIADDHPLFGEGLYGLLDWVPQTEGVGETTARKPIGINFPSATSPLVVPA
jgi:DNA-binding NarL/FixJ family response regulator